MPDSPLLPPFGRSLLQRTSVSQSSPYQTALASDPLYVSAVRMQQSERERHVVALASS